ncbi:MAG: MBL fold metallo-hydrolase [Pseudomonadota bacterium]
MSKRCLVVLLLTLLTPVPLLSAVADSAMMLTNRFAVKGDGEVNTYVFDDGETIVVVDSQRLESLAEAVAELVGDRADRVAGVLITHPHPDHVSGINVLRQAFGAPIIGSRATADELANDTMGYLALTRELYPDDSSSEPLTIDQFVADGDTLTLGDFTFEIYELGHGESVTMTLYYEASRRMLIAGDLFAVGRTPFLLDGHVLDWINQLDWLAETFDADVMVYPGHGEPGALGDLVPAQRTYLEDFVSLVAAANTDRVLSYKERQTIVDTMNERYPDHPPVAAIPDLLEQNMEAVDAELKARGNQ